MTKKIAITSGKGGVGKTNIVANLAMAYANLDYKVLIFDADPGLANIDILPAASGVEELANLTTEDKLAINEDIEELFKNYDIVIFDTAAGIGSNVTYFCTLADEIIVIVIPEKPSIIDAYGIIKVLNQNYNRPSFKLIVNSVKDENEAKAVYRRILSVSDENLTGVAISYAGFILFDKRVKEAVSNLRGFVDMYPHAMATQCIMKIAKGLCR